MRNPTYAVTKAKISFAVTCEADRRLCSHYTDRTISLLSKSKVSSLYLSSVLVQLGLCRTFSEPQIVVFPQTKAQNANRSI